MDQQPYKTAKEANSSVIRRRVSKDVNKRSEQ
jgi:hypothetical protein